MRFFFWIAIVVQFCGSEMKEILLWPMVESFVETKSGPSVVLEEVKFLLYDLKTERYVDITSDEFIFDLVERNNKFLFSERKVNKAKGERVTLNFTMYVGDLANRELVYGFNESYTLEVTESGASLVGENVFAIVRGMETFLQLVDYRRIDHLPISISDKPRYSWRGILLEVCNHYLSVDTVKKTLDAMAYNKFNVFHFHFIDSASFPFMVDEYPLLCEKGSYDFQEAVFTTQDMIDIVHYAYLRGIRVVPELEAPGHAYSWGLGYPSVVADCPSFLKNIQDIPLDPIEPLTFEISKAIIDNLKAIFKDQYYHFGGDEVEWGCWKEDKRIKEYMLEHSLSPEDLERVFMDQIYDYAKKIPIHWQERIEEETDLPIPQNSIIQIWKGAEYIVKILEHGYPIINSGGWYFDQMQPVKDKLHYSMLDVWRDMYFLEMEDFVPQEKWKMIMGGEGAMWSEQINDNVVEQRMWPKGCAVAERLWSPKSWKVGRNDDPDNDVVTRRLKHHICRNLIHRGVNASPIQIV